MIMRSCCNSTRISHRSNQYAEYQRMVVLVAMKRSLLKTGAAVREASLLKRSPHILSEQLVFKFCLNPPLLVAQGMLIQSLVQDTGPTRAPSSACVVPLSEKALDRLPPGVPGIRETVVRTERISLD